MLFIYYLITKNGNVNLQNKKFLIAFKNIILKNITLTSCKKI